MADVKINIDGIELIGQTGQSVLDVALQNGIEIPTLCHDERVKAYGSCGICVVEAENSPKLLRSCSTMISEGMIIKTNTEKVKKTRQTALELLLSDHKGDCRPPCITACPGHTDCQGYVGLIANGQFKEALELIKDVIPLPASIGRVCPHPCEEACRRTLVEEPISIANLKSFVADYDLGDISPFMPSVEESTGKKVSVIGGGPGGLTAAYFLRRAGHKVNVYDAMEKMGGMLRYGIPEYRLPKRIIDEEVSVIENLGVTMINGLRIGKDISFEYIRENSDAVVVAIGAWKSSDLRCKGEETEGVVGGIDFLREVALNNLILDGKKVAVVGGGNTAMDACRTAVRLGAESVYNIYRRTVAEMPAEEIEITEAQEEGVIFKNLTNPLEVIAENGRVSKVILQIMELGEADSSGRRAPVPVEGKTETLDVDMVIVAIGQGLDAKGFEDINLSKWNTILSDEKTFRTNLEGVFAVGDATNKGASIAIEAIGEAKEAVNIINAFLKGEEVSYVEPYIVTRDMTKEDFTDKAKIPREKMSHLSPEARKDNFAQVNFGFTEEQAKKEANRCLECGCWDYFECKLIKYANDYNVKPEKYAGSTHQRASDLSNPFLYRNPDKCILCGLCVRICDETMGRAALGLVDRGFDTIVKPALGFDLIETDCISCGQCVSVCPTGALLEMMPIEKNIPVKENITHSTCSFCSIGCKTKVATKGKLVTRTLPDDDINKKALLCSKGRFGTGELQKQQRITTPYINKGGSLAAASFYDANMYVNKKVQSVILQNGIDAVAVAVADKYTNEEIYAIKKYATDVLKIKNIYSFNAKKSGLKEVLGYDASTNTFDELENTEVIVLMCDDIVNNHTIAGIKVKKAVENGAKLILISDKEGQADEWATIKLPKSNNLDTLKAFAKVISDKKETVEKATGYDELKKYLANANVSDTIKEAAELYTNAKKAMIVYDNFNLTTDAIKLIADIAVISGHIGKVRSGIIELKANSNSQGLVDMGICTDSDALVENIKKGNIKALLIFGEDIPEINLSKVEFLMVHDYFLTETAEKANVILPAATALESTGTYTNTDRTIQKVRAAFYPTTKSNLETVLGLANISVNNMFYKSEECVLKEISENIKEYRNISEKDLCCSKSSHWPIGESPVLYQDGFNFEDGLAKLTIPSGNDIFDEKENTHVALNRFVNYMNSQGLIKA